MLEAGQTQMSFGGTTDVTQLLAAWGRGDQDALDRLMPVVYDELHRIADRALNRERTGHTLQTTALVHEAYLRLVNQRAAQVQSRAHFYAIASQLVRRILVDHARRRASAKRGAGAPAVTLETDIADDTPAVDPLALDEALTRLAALDAQQSRIVEMRFFGGLTVEETADVLGISPRTVKRDWSMARAWLRRELSGGPSS
jgi:RNA polymerase sigma factor (TIGR02999 family)